MTIDEAIKICEEDAEKIGGNPQSDRHAERCRQLAEWLTELKQWRRVYGVCPSYEMCIPECKEGYNAQIAEYKRLLKAALEDIRYLINHAKWNGKACDRCKYGNEMYCYADDCSNDAKWQHEAEALALIGKDIDVPTSADDTNVGDKKGGWISCKDNMPDTLERGLSNMYSDCCLVCDAFGWIGMAYYITDGQKSWWEFADAQNKNKIDWTEVTHWQPLPEPPKDGEQNE